MFEKLKTKNLKILDAFGRDVARRKLLSLKLKVFPTNRDVARGGEGSTLYLCFLKKIL